MKIAIDMHGGDFNLSENVKAVIQALEEDKSIELLLVGNSEQIEKEMQICEHKDRIEILDAPQIIDCNEDPAKAILFKKKSSIVLALKALSKRDDVQAFVSSGSTGALMAGSYLIVGSVNESIKPALAPFLPRVDGGKMLLLDAGANPECLSSDLVNFAKMGIAYYNVNFSKKPKLAILSNGTEDTKGTFSIREAAEIIRKFDGIEFLGQVEARDALNKEIDILVCDGMQGNVLLKGFEAMANAIFTLLKSSINSFKTKIGALLLKPSLKGLKLKLDYNKNGGALLLGLKKIVIKCHGSSKAEAIKISLLEANRIAKAGLNDEIIKRLGE